MALFISYFRLKNRFKNKKIFLALNLKSYEELNLALENNDIVFIFPHQLKYINRKYFDLTLSISALHEMERNVIKFYMDNIDQISKSLYFTVWRETLIPFSLRGTRLFADDKNYFIKDNWKEISNKRNFFPSNIIQKAYLVN